MTDVLNRIDVREFLTELDVKVAGASGHNVLFSCPWHRDKHPSARMSTETTQWVCSAGCGSGNAISFLAKLRDISNSEAWKLLKGRYGIGNEGGLDELEAEVDRNLTPPTEVSADYGDPPHEEWASFFAGNLWRLSSARSALNYILKERGFSEETLRKWEIGYDQYSDRITIPVRDVDARLVGFKARAWRKGHEPRYLILGDPPRRTPRYGFSPYRKSEYVYGLYRVPAGSPVVIVEGELNVVAIDQKCPEYRAAGLAGVEFSSRQRRLIVERCSEAIVFLDDNHAGRRGTEKVSKMLSPYMGLWVVVGASGDAAELTATQIQAEIMDAYPSLFHSVSQTS